MPTSHLRQLNLGQHLLNWNRKIIKYMRHSTKHGLDPRLDPKLDSKLDSTTRIILISAFHFTGKKPHL